MVEQLKKVPTGIAGLDELTGGGLPAGRPTLVCGGPGCGKTLLATTFLVRGALDHGEPGLLVSFDERIPDMGVNVASLDFDLPDLEARGLLATDYVHIDRQEMHETGEYDLEALFIRLNLAVNRVAPVASCSTPSTRCSPAFPMKALSDPSCVGCSVGSKTASSRP